MMRIRKCEGIWEVRRITSNRSCTWDEWDDLESLQEYILETAMQLDHLTRTALDVMHGTSETYLYQNGTLSRRTPVPPNSCLTPFLQQSAELATIIPLIESGIWRVRAWKTPPCLAHFSEDSWLPEKKVKASYLIPEPTADESILPRQLLNMFSAEIQLSPSIEKIDARTLRSEVKEALRVLIVRLRESGRTNKETAALVKGSQTHCRNVWQRHKNQETKSYLPGTGD